MKKALLLTLIFSLVSVLMPACKKKPATAKESAMPAHGGHMGGASENVMTGMVLETMDVASYTYVRLKNDASENWVAGPKTTVKTGDTVVIADPMAMENYESKSLNRTFDLIFFTGAIRSHAEWIAGHAAKAPHGEAKPGHPDITPAEMTVEKVEKAQGGLTVDEIFKNKDKLQGKEVVVRAKVVKANFGIMGKNWLHVRDGSGEEGSNDLTVVTLDKPETGDIVLIKGIFSKEKDIGMGYRFNGIVEDAKIAVEKQ